VFITTVVVNVRRSLCNLPVIFLSDFNQTLLFGSF